MYFKLNNDFFFLDTQKRYLCVDSSQPAVMKYDDDGTLPRFYNCFLVPGDDPRQWKGLKDKNPTQASIVFRIVPTALETSNLKNVTTTIRIEHKTPDGRKLYFSDIADLKPKYTYIYIYICVCVCVLLFICCFVS
jgi:hypothetical protein